MLKKTTVLGLCATLAAMMATTVMAGGSAMPDSLLASTGNSSNQLLIIDPMGGAGTLVGSIGSQGPVTSLAFASDGTLFGATGGGTANLLTIDPETGTETLVGMHSFGALTGMAFVGETLYGALFQPPTSGVGGNITFVSVDTTTANLTTIGPMNVGLVRGMAYDVETGVLYGVGFPAGGPTEGVEQILFTVNTANGTITEIGTLGPTVDVGAMAIGPDGTFYAGTVGGGPDGGAELVTLDRTTGAATVVGAIGFPAIAGMSFAPGAPVMAPQEIPTLGWAGLLLLVGLLGAAGFAVLRR